MSDTHTPEPPEADSGLFLGLDSSTQSLTALVIDHLGRVLHRESVRFDDELPGYGTRGGQLPSEDPSQGHAPPLMWVEALDLLFQKLSAQQSLTNNVKAIALAGQQHGSVYLTDQAKASLAALDPALDLEQQLRNVFSRASSPIWTDSSTTTECQEIRESLGGTAATARLTGSDCFERFTGPQIRRFSQLDPEGYRDTTDIALVSSFMTSLLIGDLAPIDHGDGSGMNLMDITSRQWSARALEATANGLAGKLPALATPSSAAGQLAPYYSRYGFGPCLVAVGTGDNPSSALGMGLRHPGDMAISLGTSDTVFSIMSEVQCDDSGASHVFIAPNGAPMSLLCFRNGSLARERVRDRFDLDWRSFSQAIERTPPGNHGRLMIPWFDPEIVPRSAGSAPAHGVTRSADLGEDDPDGNCRAVVEGQALAMRLHSEWNATPPRRIVAAGGGSLSRSILQIVADVFGCQVKAASSPDAAALGAAMRARNVLGAREGSRADAESADEAPPIPPSGTVDTVEPSRRAHRAYDALLEDYRQLVDQQLATPNEHC